MPIATSKMTKINTVITDSFRFHLNLRSTSLTNGSIIRAVNNAKISGMETGSIKNKATIVIATSTVMNIVRLVNHFVTRHSSKLCIIPIIAKVNQNGYKKPENSIFSGVIYFLRLSACKSFTNPSNVFLLSFTTNAG